MRLAIGCNTYVWAELFHVLRMPSRRASAQCVHGLCRSRYRGGGKRIPGVKYGEKALRVTPQLLWRAGVEVACTGAHWLGHTRGDERS